MSHLIWIHCLSDILLSEPYTCIYLKGGESYSNSLNNILTPQ